MNGTLSEQPLAELIREISLRHFSGTLRLRRERVRIVIYFEQGKPIFAAANLRNLRLGEYLKKRDLVPEDQITALSNGGSDVNLAKALSESGLLHRHILHDLLAAQVNDLLRVSLLWTDGSWEFDDRARLAESVRVELDTVRILIEASRKMRLKFVGTRFPNMEEKISPVIGLPDFNSLLPTEGFILSRIEGPIALGELIALSGLRELDVMRTVYGLSLAAYLEREHWSYVLGEALKPSFSRAAAASQSSPEPDTITMPEQSEEQDLEQLFMRMEDAENHYQVLDLPLTAELAEIKASYYVHARRYHPDRFHGKAQPELHARIESTFARITQAYETLIDPSSRKAYDARLAGQQKAREFSGGAPKPEKVDDFGSEQPGSDFSAERLPEAEANFREGFSALQQGNTKIAITHLAAAAHAAPDEPRYRAYYGRALAANQSTRRMAELEMQAAIKLEPENANFRAMLAELYWELAFYKRAQAEAERAASLDPGNQIARVLLRKLKATRKVG